MKCGHKIRDKCPRGHVLTWRCCDGHPASCRICDAETRAHAEQQARDVELEQARQARQSEYASKLATVQAEIDRHRRECQAGRDEEDQEATLQQRLVDLENAKSRAAQLKATRSTTASKTASKPKQGGAKSVTKVASTAEAADALGARADWERQKSVEGAQNKCLDQLMGMIGLENVKDQFLEIKSKIDLSTRQDVSITKERLGAALLGNPGTGMSKPIDRITLIAS